jgi:hypothetical protein
LITPTWPQSNPEEFMGVTGIEIAAFPTRFSHFFSVEDSVFLSFLTI